MSECAFCQIAAGTGPASMFFADDLVLGIMDISARKHIPRVVQAPGLSMTGRAMH